MAKLKDVDNWRKIQTDATAAQQSIREVDSGLAALFDRAGFVSVFSNLGPQRNSVDIEGRLNHNDPLIVAVDNKTADALKAIGFEPTPSEDVTPGLRPHPETRYFTFATFDDDRKYEALVRLLAKLATDKVIDSTTRAVEELLSPGVSNEINQGISRIDHILAEAAMALPGIEIDASAERALREGLTQTATAVMSGRVVSRGGGYTDRR